MTACLLLLLAATSAFSQEKFHSNPRAGADFYISTYGKVPEESIPHVYRVFERVKSVADKSSFHAPELVVINDEHQASAFVLSDGTIFLSIRALELFYEDVDRSEADARLAFVLGHELAHLANNHFWDDQISQALSAAADPDGLQAIINTSADQQKKEFKADDQGFLYAALAGYRVDLLLGDGGRHLDFLAFWEQKIGPLDEDGYPSADQRTRLLRLRLAEKLAAAEYFSMGVRLAAFGRHDEAIPLFQAFRSHFPGRAVLNNMGHSYLNAGLALLSPDLVYHYWIPGIADLDNHLNQLSIRRGGSTQAPGEQPSMAYPAEARNRLLRAVELFDSAVEKDPKYPAAYINLATAHYFLGLDTGPGSSPSRRTSHYAAAKVAIESAVSLQAEKLQVQVLDAIITSKLNGTEGVETDVYQLAQQAQDADSDAALFYNLARLAFQNPSLAESFWRETVAQFDSQPLPIRQSLCRQAADQRHSSINGEALATHCRQLHRPRGPSATAPPWTLPVEVSRDLLEEPFTAREQARFGWQTLRLNDMQVYSNTDFSVLAIDAITSIVVLKEPNPGEIEALERCCGQPLSRRTMMQQSVLWDYGYWAAVVRDGRIREVWVADY